jgi:anti-anti-sigma factor
MIAPLSEPARGADLTEPYHNVEVELLDAHRAGVALSGALAMADAETVERLLADLARQVAPERVVVDLSGLEFLDSHGVRALFRAREEAERAGGGIALRPGNGPILRTLELVDAASAFEFLPEPPADRR